MALEQGDILVRTARNEHEEAAWAKRVLMRGFDGANFQTVATDPDGHLQIDVLSGTGGTEFDDGDSIDTDSQGKLLMGTTGVPGTARAIRTNASGQIDVRPLNVATDSVLSGTYDFARGLAITSTNVGSDEALDVFISNEPTVTANAGSIVDAGNSTTTPLSGGGNFTGTGVDLLGFTAVCINVATDKSSSTDGMKFQFSSDNTNWDDTYSFTFDSTDGSRRFQFPVTSRYFRVNYTTASGAPGNQTYFRLQTILHTGNELTSIHRIDDNTSKDRSAQLMKSAIIAQVNGSGDFINIQASAGGVLKTSVGDIEPGTGADNLGKAEDAAHATGDTGVMMFAVRNDSDSSLVGTDGDYAPLQVDSLGGLKVQGTVAADGALHNPLLIGCNEFFGGNVDYQSTVTVGAGLNAMLTLFIGLNGGFINANTTTSAMNINGDLAHDAIDSLSFPVKVGTRSLTDIMAGTEVANNDRSDAFSDRFGHLLIDSGQFSASTGTVTTTSDTTIIAAPGVGLKLQVYVVEVSLVPDDISAIGGDEYEGIEFSVDGAGSYQAQSVFAISTYPHAGSGDVDLLSLRPYNINLQHGHWDCSTNTAFSAKQMGLTPNTLAHSFRITAWYRTLSA